MTGTRDYYEILGVDRSADAAAIKKAYRKLAKKYHPDSNAGNAQAAEHFKEVNEAYDVLGDPEKRKLYDQYGAAAFDGTGAEAGGFQNGQGFGGFHSGQGFSGGGQSYGGTDGFHTYHFEGGDMGDVFGDIFGDMFKGGTGGRSGFRGSQGQSFGGGRGMYRSRGEDASAEIEVSFDEAAFGGDRMITLTGADGKSQTLKVHIPAGIETGKSIRLKGKGNPGIGGGEAGDLLLRVTVGERPGFERKGMDVYTTAEIPYTTAVFGGEALVHTLYGDVICKIRPGTQCGSRIRLTGKGIVSMKNAGQHGDQYVTIQISVPRSLNPREEQALKEYERAGEAKTAGRNGTSAA